MVWGLELISGFNPFPFGPMSIIGALIFFFIFGYIINRNKPNPVEISLEIAGYSLLIGFILVLLDLPPLYLGTLYIFGYILVSKHVSKTKTNFAWFFSVFYLIIIFAIYALLDDFTRLYWLVFVIVFMVALSELERHEKKSEKEKPKK